MEPRCIIHSGGIERSLLKINARVESERTIEIEVPSVAGTISSHLVGNQSQRQRARERNWSCDQRLTKYRKLNPSLLRYKVDTIATKSR